MNKKLALLIPVTTLLLTGCVGNTHYDSASYVKNVEWRRTGQDYRVLTLGDIHFSITDNYQEHFDVMQKTINSADPDLIVVNGDAFTFASKQTVVTLFTWLDTRKNKSGNPIDWTFTFGNHDDQGQYADTWIPREMCSGHYEHVACPDLKKLENDDVTGRTNFVLNLMQNNVLKYQLYVLDSHSYNFQKFKGEYKHEKQGYYYDFIKQDQIDWYERMVNETAVGKGDVGLDVRSSAFFHIPLAEFNELFDTTNPSGEWTLKPGIDLITGDGAEGLVSSPQINTGLFDKIKELGLTQSVTCSHDHVNNFVCLYEGIYLTYGTHATNRIYYAKDKIGGQLLKVAEDGGISFENIFTENDYPEVQLL